LSINLEINDKFWGSYVDQEARGRRQRGKENWGQGERLIASSHLLSPCPFFESIIITFLSSALQPMMENRCLRLESL
jgi:hypothetical protein